MQGTAEGLSLDDIEGEFGVSRRTAERMRDAVMRLCPAMESTDSADGRRRWRIRGTHALSGLAAVTADELASLDHAIRIQEQARQGDHLERLQHLSEKLRAAISRRDRLRLEPDLEALMKAEGLAARPGPHPLDAHDVVEPLRNAILRSTKVVIHYRTRNAPREKRQKILPYGFLYGNRHYLVGFSTGARDYRLFTLSNISRIEILDEPFEPDPAFSLEAYAQRSFGVFQGDEVQDIEWKFDAEVADDVLKFHFHPTQAMLQNADGSVTVKFSACGLREMCWHLVTWAGYVEVIEPPELRAAYQASVSNTQV